MNDYENYDAVGLAELIANGEVVVLKKSMALEAGEVIDASKMSKAKLTSYFEKEMADAKANDLMLSLHLKATMMKISDPIMFGHAVKVFFKVRHARAVAMLGRLPC